MPGSGLKIEWRDGNGPLAFRVAVVAIISDFVLMFGALVWRDFFAPTEPKPGLVESLGMHSSRYYVPAWFKPAETAAAILFVTLFFLLLILCGYYHELLAPEEKNNDS